MKTSGSLPAPIFRSIFPAVFLPALLGCALIFVLPAGIVIAQTNLPIKTTMPPEQNAQGVAATGAADAQRKYDEAVADAAAVDPDANPEDLPAMTPAEVQRAGSREMIDRYRVDLGEQGTGGYSAQSENAYLEQSMAARREESPLPATSLILRRYAATLMKKYDTNRDGRLQENEWSAMPGHPQSVDMDGDFVLDESELLFYLARYAKGRTIFQPEAGGNAAARAVSSSDSAVLIQPLSAKMSLSEEGRGEQEKTETLADMTEEELQEMVDESDAAVGTEGNSELFELLLDEMDESKLREYSAPREDLAGMPVWFLARDLNGDGQLSLNEFAPKLSIKATAFFGRLDADADGLVTPDEVRAFLNSGAPTVP